MTKESVTSVPVSPTTSKRASMRVFVPPSITPIDLMDAFTFKVSPLTTPNLERSRIVFSSYHGLRSIILFQFAIIFSLLATP